MSGENVLFLRKSYQVLKKWKKGERVAGTGNSDFFASQIFVCHYRKEKTHLKVT